MRHARLTNASRSLLAFLCYRWCCLTWTIHLPTNEPKLLKTEEEYKLKEEQDYITEQVKSLKHYEITTPAIYNSGDLDGLRDTSTMLQIGAFGRTYDILIPKKKQFEYDTYVEYLGKNNSYEARYIREDGCFYSGLVNVSDSGSSMDVVLNYCNGIVGMIHSTNSLIFIEPIKNSYHPPSSSSFKKNMRHKHIVYRGDDVTFKTSSTDFQHQQVLYAPNNEDEVGDNRQRRRRRGIKMTPYQSYLTFINKSGRTIQLYYLDAFKSHIPFISFVVHEKRSVNTYLGTTWIAKDDKTGQEFLLNGKSEFIAKKSSASRRITVIMTKPDDFRETTNSIGGSGQLTNSVGGDHHYIEVLVVADDSVIKFHGRNRIEKYILTMMDIAARVFKHKSLGLIIHFQVVRIVLIEDNESGFTVYKKNPTKTLKSACNFISSLQNTDQTDRDHFDFGIALTRKDFGPSGFAQLYSMCSSSRSCALVQDEGLTSAFIVAHETGHLLGLEHDGEGEASRCTHEGPRGSIMAPVIVARYDRYSWSKCSREVLKENIEYFQCLQNTPRERFKPSLRNHGALYSLTEQCQFNFDKEYTTCTSFTFNPCRRLWCSKSNSNSYCKTMRGPALEGTICKPNMHCSKGDCVEYDNRIHAQELGIIQKTVHGGWGRWSKWSSCSRTCRVGIRSRRRRCDDPRPTSNGLPCHGENIQREVCNSKKCQMESLRSRQIKHCQSAYGDLWTVYSDEDFTARLQKRGHYINCSFENTFCNWANDEGKNKINWELNGGATQSFNTGPIADNTFGDVKGKYIYVEASGTRNHSKKKGDVSRLISRTINVPRICFTMHYHMFGRDMGLLRVKIKHKNNSEHTLWKTSGNKGDKWLQAQVSFESVGSYKIVIEAVRGQHWASDIAIDDVSAVTGFCSSDRRSRYECKVSCRTKDFGAFKMDVNVTNGESCGGKRSSNICLDGKCVTFGCDNKFDSNLKTDDCGLCGGNGSKCTKIRGSRESRPMKDYEILLTIERGSTFIDLLLQYLELRYYYVLRTVRDNSLKMIVNDEAYVRIADADFYFTKVNNRQRIVSDGPLSEQVDVIIYTFPQYRRNKSLYIHYQYFKPTSTKFTYEYKTVGWEICSRSCGTGQQKSAVLCMRIQDKVTVEKSFCDGLEIPLYIRACRLNPCPRTYKWLTKNWESCSKSCDGGVRTRMLVCQHMKSNAVVENRLCPVVRPRQKEACNTSPCPKWHTATWNTCSRTCGSGIQTRDVKCIDQSTGNAVEDKKCLLRHKPDNRSPCNTQPCETYIYVIQGIGRSCSKSCGGGFRIQIVNCVKNSTKDPVQNFYCDGPSPPRLAVCNQHKCPEFVWKVRSSPCSHSCGNGTSVRQVFCVNLENDQKGDEKNCRATKPASVVRCNTGSCPVYNWKVHDATPCSASCGNGTITRQLSCVNQDNGQTVDKYKCVLDSKPTPIVSCNMRSCPVYSWKIQQSSTCSSSCGNGTISRDVVCVDESSNKTVKGENCPQNKPAVNIDCFQHNCPVYKWKVHESSPCSTTCGNGSISREIVCINGETNKIVNAIYCPQKKLAEIFPCFTTSCVNYEVRYSPWGSCSVSCGKGMMRRTYSCYETFSGQVVSKQLCHDKKVKGKLLRRCQSTSGCREGDKLFCDFDKSTFCEWKNILDDDFDWSIGRKTPSVYTGPEHDHTTKEGYFAYIEASLPRRRNEKAILYSPSLKLPRGCFLFWYHMRGEGDMGSLRVLLSSNNRKEIVFERKDHQGEYWLQAKIDIKMTASYQIIFEAIRGSGVYSDVAIDDISFQNKDCNKITSKKPHNFLLKQTGNCREISPYCKHRNRDLYCRGSPAYRKLCCRTCPGLISTKPNITVIDLAKKIK